MLSKVKSIVLYGLEGYLAEVQVDISSGMPYWDVVGLPDISVKEAKERVKTAIKNSGFEFKSRKIVVNLSPADLKKEGTYFDLPIAIGILQSLGEVKKIENNIAFIGELSLDGSINKINGVLPICMEAKRLGINKIILPKENAKEGGIIKGIDVIGARNIKEVVNFLNGKIVLEVEENINTDLLKEKTKFNIDFADVKGQENVKRALEISAAGGHNCIMIGPPGAGKTMLAQRLPTILPDLNFDEALEITKIYSVSGVLPKESPIITTRQFRAPHHTITQASLIGGGRFPKPGEISLAHFGVLFLDEMQQFSKSTLDLLRGPLEDGKITINRMNYSLTYPSKFMLIASINPCPCGYYGSKEKECICSKKAISNYISRISGPLLDRIDIQVEVSPVKYLKLQSNKKIETSEKIKSRVNIARKIQQERYKEHKIFSNAELNSKLITKYCKLDKSCEQIMQSAFERLGLSARAYSRILKVARTIADLEESENIQNNHLLEAIQYRSLDRKYWRR